MCSMINETDINNFLWLNWGMAAVAGIYGISEDRHGKFGDHRHHYVWVLGLVYFYQLDCDEFRVKVHLEFV